MKSASLRLFIITPLLLASLVISGVLQSGALASQPPVATPQAPAENPLRAERLGAVGLGQSGIYLIRLRQPPLASYRGEIPGLEATNPGARGENKLNANSPASLAYRDYLLARQAEFVQRMEENLGRKVEVKFNYYAATNGLAVYLTPEESEQVRQLPDVAFLQPNYMRYLETDVSPQWIGATGLWDGSTTGGLPGTKGEGIIVGVIDSGINPSNPSFADVGGDGYNHTNPWGAGVYVGVCDPANVNYDSSFACNDKLIGAWDFATADGINPRDVSGHGSHTSSTAAGNAISAPVVGHTITINRSISGIAPHANIVMYTACLADGCPFDALTAAIDQVVIDGVDAVNYSIGSAAPSDVWNDTDTLGFLSARDAGIFVSTSAGNRGPDPATTGNPADAPWLMSNAAASHNRKTVNVLQNLSGGSTTPPADIYGVSFTSGYGPAAIVYAGNYGDALCQTPFAAGTFSGQIVICDRGVNARVDKGSNVLAGGAGGFILANDVTNGASLESDDHFLPAVHITYADGVKLKAWVADGGPTHLGTIRGTVLETNDSWGDILASFSSRGPNRAVADILKPNIANPGEAVLAAIGIGDPNPAQWSFYSGTSMASPHGAGAGALMKALHPTWTPDEIQSALQMTAWQAVTDYDGTLPDPFDEGSGRMDLTVASKAGLVLNETRANYEAANPATGGDPSTLNLPSLGKGACNQTCAWTRTFRSTASASVTWNIELAAWNGMDLTVSPSSFIIPAGGTQSITVTADVRRAPQDAWAFGELRLIPTDPNIPTAHLPVGAFAKSATNTAVLAKTASVDLVQQGGTIHYTVTLTHKSLASATYNLSDPVPANTTYVSGSAAGGWTYNSGTNTLSWSGTMPAGAFVVSEENRSGYISMGDLGVPPADLTGLNLDTGCFSLTGMNFTYWGTAYTQAIVSLNGVLRAGTFPLCPSDTNAKIPVNDFANNIMAPWWADLNFTSGGHLYLVATSYNGAPHTVISWENVPLDTGGTATFQVWIQDGTDNIWFAYPPGGVPGGSPTATVGGENSGGTAGYQYYYNGTGKVPTGTVDLVLGPQATVKTFTFDVTASATPSATNTATVTTGSSTYTAYDYTSIYNQNTWLGNTTAWASASNWSRNAVPTSADWVIIPTSPSGGNMPLLSGNAAVFNLVVQPGASLDLGTYQLTAQEGVQNQGKLKQTVAALPANTTASLLHLTSASGAQDKYFGVDVKPTAGALGSTTVQVRGNAECTTTDPTNTVNRCYEITPATAQASNVRFYFLSGELDGQSPAKLNAWLWGPGWSPAGTTAGRGQLRDAYYWVDASGVTTFKPFTLTEKVSGPTNVTMVGLSARAGDQRLPTAIAAIGLLGMIGVALVVSRRKRSN
jgi:uncharacterized repeat protein (TIGR01451 family)